MFKVKHTISRFGLALTATAFALHLSVAHAVPFNTDISIDASSSFDAPFSSGGNGNFGVVSGGTSTVSTYANDSTVTGANPILSPLTDINDGVGFSGNTFSSTTSVIDAYFALGLDTSLNLTNNSSSEAYEVVFKLDYKNMVNADGADAWSRSTLTVEKDTFTLVFFSDLLSDSLFSDFDGVANTGTFGDVLSQSGEEFFNVFINPLDTLQLEMNWTLEGEDLTLNGLAEADLSAFLSVHAVNVPLPGTFILVGIGMLMLPLQRRMRALIKS